jgi:prepilin-type N-terminal cleavage/methylation domain-containing protein
MHVRLSKTRCRAMTLIELMISTGLSGLLAAAAMMLMYYAAHNFAAMANYVDLDRRSRSALDRMSSEIRQADKLNTYATNQLVFQYGGTTLTYAYNSTNKTLTRTYNGTSTELLNECQNLQFLMFQRNTVSNTWDQFAVTDPSLCKEVELTWTCSRKILGKAMNTESVQSARVVMRKP